LSEVEDAALGSFAYFLEAGPASAQLVIANLGRVKDRNRRLKNLLEDFAKPALDLSPSRVTEDIIGECYIYLISRFASDAGKKAGEFYTPAAVSRLLAKLAAPKPGNTICDPACGSGSLLIRAAEEVGSENFALYGQEVNGATWALARSTARRASSSSWRARTWPATTRSPSCTRTSRTIGSVGATNVLSS
jgi:type I restriction enzyme M protein